MALSGCPRQTSRSALHRQQGNGTWSQQAKFPVGFRTVPDIAGSFISPMALSTDGDTLAVIAENVPDHPALTLDIEASDFSCGPMVGNLVTALYARNGTAWTRQAVISRDLKPCWAFDSDGNALLYGGVLCSRNNGVWACPCCRSLGPVATWCPGPGRCFPGAAPVGSGAGPASASRGLAVQGRGHSHRLLMQVESL